LPVLLVGSGVYLLRDYVFKSKKSEQRQVEFSGNTNAQTFAGTVNDASFRADDFDAQTDFATKVRTRKWKER
jgi:hypothetical protein